MKPIQTIIIIIQSQRDKNLFYINTKPIFKDNWSIQKNRFTPQEQELFETAILKKKYEPI